MLFLLLFFLSSCQEDNLLVGEDVSSENIKLQNKNEPSDRQVIVLAAPSIHNDYYADIFDDIVAFQVDFANKIDGKDEVIILVDNDTRPYFNGKVADYVLVEAIMEDIWIRDYGPVIADAQIKFDYLPDYNTRRVSNLIDNSFESWYDDSGLKYGEKSNIILDGGNVVDNGKGRVVVTDRILYDNPQLTKSIAKKKLKRLLGAHEVAIIKETPGDATGHSDGMVMWVDENTILLHDQPKRVKRSILRELKRSFRGVKIIVVPDYYEDETWRGFSSACNIFVNSLVTNNYIYVPTFNSSYDEEMLGLIESYSSKTIVEVPAEKVCYMGGSVRCMTWQAEGKFADRLLEE